MLSVPSLPPWILFLTPSLCTWTRRDARERCEAVGMCSRAAVSNHTWWLCPRGPCCLTELCVCAGVWRDPPLYPSDSSVDTHILVPLNEAPKGERCCEKEDFVPSSVLGSPVWLQDVKAPLIAFVRRAQCPSYLPCRPMVFSISRWVSPVRVWRDGGEHVIYL